MALRTYLPTLRVIVRAVCSYIAKNEEKIKANIGDGNTNKVDAALLACQTLVAALNIVIVDGD